MLPDYAELHCRSNYSFLTGASHPEELVVRAHALGYAALAVTDECSLGGVVRAHAEANGLSIESCSEFSVGGEKAIGIYDTFCRQGYARYGLPSLGA